MWRGRVVAISAALALNVVLVASEPFYSVLQKCPADCAGTPESWTVWDSTERLLWCDQPVLLDFAIYNPIDNPDTTVRLRTCASTRTNHTDSRVLAPYISSIEASESVNTSACFTSTNETKVALDLFASDDHGDASRDSVQTALSQMEAYLVDDNTHCETKFLVGYSQGAAVALYSGTGIDNLKTVSPILQRLMSEVGSGDASAPKSMTLQLCGKDRNSDHTFGVAIDTSGDLAAVQRAAKAWSDGTCATAGKLSHQITDISIHEIAWGQLKPMSGFNESSTNTTSLNTTYVRERQVRYIQARADCKTVAVVSGDSCGTLATKCAISASDFTKYNPSSTLCSGLVVGQRVCCSSGTLPDLTPKPNSNGTCATYTVKTDDYCAVIAASNGLTVTQVETFNNKTTWGWNGCGNLFAGINICLSKGTPPLPAPVPNALCGPIMPGTKYPNASQALADLNPCPLNTCCDVWGQCGMTPEYCTITLGPSGNPGTAPTGKNGCISNCGTDIKNNKNAPSSFMKIGYYESWNWDRHCLNYRAQDIGGADYTHVHWAFATIGDGLSVSINDTYKQLPDFLALGAKKIVSFGGWGYSTDPATYNALRAAMNPGNVDTFATNIANFVNSQGFDGVDIDWEYPGAPDIPGIPAGLATDGPNYLSFLRALRKKLATGKSLSIAAPASYWYLKSFPIAEMSKLVDYIVYMTYDLHGQWDYNNQWSQDGCKTGNCLRSHVNLTETGYTLAMITKAGVDASKVAVGVSSYGRSFGMKNRAACEHNLNSAACSFTGPDSGAAPGECTATNGYISNAEIDEIINLNASDTVVKFDAGSDTDIIFYGNNWVSYMTDTTKSTRTSFYQGLNFGGTVDWAVDLQAFTDDDLHPGGDDDNLPPTDPLSPCTATYNTIEDLDAAAASIPDHCVTIYTLIALNNLLTETLTNYTDMMADGYDKKFKTYAGAVAGSAGKSLEDFVNGHGSDYFTCIISELSTCCSECKNNAHSASYCDYCFDGKCYKSCNGITGCQGNKREMLSDTSDIYANGLGLSPRDGVGPVQVLITSVVNTTQGCPPDYSKRGYGPDNPYEQSVYWTMVNDTGFYADLATNTGIPKDKTKMGNNNRGNDCAPSAKSNDDCWGFGYDYNIPLINGYSSADVANPKDVVSKGLDNAKSLGPQIDSIVSQLRLDGWFGDGGDLIDSLSMPIFMLASATENMEMVDDIADKIDEEKRKAFILAFLSAIFLIIPVIGEVLSSVAELADIGVILSLIGAAGNAATDIYTIVDDPANAPLAIFDLILSPLALADVAKIAKAADLRRAMKEEDVAKLGGKLEGRMKTIEKVKGTCAPIPVDP